MSWRTKWLIDFNTEKIQLVSFDRSNNSRPVDMKMGGTDIVEESSFKMPETPFTSKLH